MKILVIRLSSLGDLVILSSVFEMLKNMSVEVHLLTYSHFASIYEHDRRVKKILKIPKPYGIRDILNVIKTVRAMNYDFAFDLQRKLLSYLILKASGAGEKLIYNNRRRERLRALKGKKIDEIPVYELYAEPIRRALGIDKPPPCPKLEPVVADIELPEDYIVIAPGAAHRTKIWPYFSDLVKLIKNNLKEIQIVAVGDKNDSKLVEPYKKDVIDLTGKTTIRELLFVIENSRLVISNDSAPMHIASAYNVPVIAFFGPTIPEFGFRPCNAHVFEVPLACRPCSLHGSESCPLGHFKCMRLIEPEKVFKKIEQIIKS